LLFISNSFHQLFFPQIEKGRQVVMFVLSDIVEKSILIFLQNTEVVTYLIELLSIQLCHLCCHEVLFVLDTIFQKLMLFNSRNIPSLVLIFDEQSSDQITAGDAHRRGYPCILCLDLLVENVLHVVLEGEIAMHHGVEDYAARPYIDLTGVVCLLI
jgi:hypothetical protein